MSEIHSKKKKQKDPNRLTVCGESKVEEGEISRLHDLIRKDYLTLIDLIFEMIIVY